MVAESYAGDFGELDLEDSLNGDFGDRGEAVRGERLSLAHLIDRDCLPLLPLARSLLGLRIGSGKFCCVAPIAGAGVM